MTNAASSRRPKVLRGIQADAAASALGSTNLAAFDRNAIGRRLNATEAAEAARKAGFEKGYQEGLEAARAEVEAAMDDANKRVRRALAALCEAVDNLDQREATALADVEDAIVAGAFGVSHAILQRELNSAVDPGAEAIARALALVPARGEVVARLNPDDVATLSLDRVSTTTRTVHVVADAAVEPGGCIVEVGDAQIDSQLSTALVNVGKALGLTDQAEALAPMTRNVGDQTNRQHQDSAAAGSSASDSGMTAEETPVL